MGIRYFNAALAGQNAGWTIYWILTGQHHGWAAFLAGTAIMCGVTALVPEVSARSAAEKPSSFEGVKSN